ncbi:uncharacterized protein TRAVEDRAFT_45049 [Trametes versicolor FP-101664 SS1]|uniref:uncharacterized protein n=1 Tax=Trametes versicolor (strain FP-101664) TaxID=717944 RepID=UPI0004623C93|nr:uncharacterized protein TRAVEDRAFT_45049 [Trametes versicolor FP-101664 SS1]EIW62216.1 hypothetical protein TRAVEDRAFT_45049 [Trametes versicolor FP-101664 SS1]
MYTLPGVIVPGVHLGCTYKCRGCGYVYNQRFDNWGCRPPAEGVHGAGCLTAKFWRGQMSSQDLEEALTEQEEKGGSLAERVEEPHLVPKNKDEYDSAHDDLEMPSDADEDGYYAMQRKTRPASAWQPAVPNSPNPGLAEELLILEEQLYRQSWELPHTVDKALDAQLRVDVPMDVESPSSSEESSSDSSAAPDSSESDFARARPRRRMPARPRPARRNHADKENASSPARRPRARASSVVSYAKESSESESDDSDYVPSGSAARVKKGKGKGRARAPARAPTRPALVEATNVHAHEPASSERPVHYYGLYSDEEASETSSQ